MYIRRTKDGCAGHDGINLSYNGSRASGGVLIEMPNTKGCLRRSGVSVSAANKAIRPAEQGGDTIHSESVY